MEAWPRIEGDKPMAVGGKNRPARCQFVHCSVEAENPIVPIGDKIENQRFDTTRRHTLNETDLRALTPLIWEHAKPYGRFELDMTTRLPIG